MDAKHHHEVATKSFRLLNHPFILNELSVGPLITGYFIRAIAVNRLPVGAVGSDRVRDQLVYLHHAEFFMHITTRKNPGFTIVSGTAGFRLFDEMDLWPVF